MRVIDALKTRVAVALLSLSIGGAGAIVAHEGMRPVAYRDPVGIVTVCAGHTKTAKLGEVKSKAECLKLLQQDVAHAEAAIKRLTTTPLTQRQYDALVSFVFNLGEGNYAKSTLLERINAGQCHRAADEFLKWNKATRWRIVAPGGPRVKESVVLPGLTARRQEESLEFRSGCAAQ